MFESVGRRLRQAVVGSRATLFTVGTIAIAAIALVILAMAAGTLAEPYRWLFVGPSLLLALLFLMALKLHRDLQLIKSELMALKVHAAGLDEQVQGSAQVLSERIVQLRQAVNDSGKPTEQSSVRETVRPQL